MIFFFQSVCVKIFSDDQSNMLTGLLHGAPSAYRNQIESVLTECRGLVGVDQLQKTDQVFNELKQVLADSIK